MAKGKDSKRKSSRPVRDASDSEDNADENKRMRCSKTSGSRSRSLSRQRLPKQKPKSKDDQVVSICGNGNSYVQQSAINQNENASVNLELIRNTTDLPVKLGQVVSTSTMSKRKRKNFTDKFQIESVVSSKPAM